MQTPATIVLGDWEVSLANCHFTCTGRREVPRARLRGGYFRLKLPFSVESLLKDHAAFGLVSDIRTLLGLNPCVAVVAEYRTETTAAGPTVVPCLITNLQAPLCIWIHTEGPDSSRARPRFCIFFVTPVQPHEMTTYVYHEDGGPSDGETYEPQGNLSTLPSGEFLLSGQLRAVAPRTYVTYFATPAPLSYMDLLSFEVTGPEGRNRNIFAPKYLTVARSGHVYKLTAYNTLPQKVACLNFNLAFKPIDAPKILVMGQASPLMHTPVGAQVMAIYPDCEKTIQPGETTTLRIQLLFEQPSEEAPLAFVVIGLTDQEVFITSPSIVTQARSEQLWIFNPNNYPVHISRNTVVACAMACHIHPRSETTQTEGFSPAHRTWHVGSHEIQQGHGGITAPKCHIAIRESHREEVMDH
ncbi:ORF10 [Retroperitoneal fibromatosis-associated herpesvirus]|uniref:ORF10 n=1 Tax=Retroperitoneal fibromatosis-associated herpesvirus TaxID=111469 RepID=U5NIT5_9GAMA|nr:ORF10 [Retroperitoneal fibromatosis-associated herpesvirus]AGY30689.1 ORF10 [Retroperitoneal fibromatosis-associated herpesvirus]